MNLLTQRAAQVYGYFVIFILALFAILVWLGLVPQDWYWTLVLLAALLFMIRLTLKLVLDRQKRVEEREREAK
jgi:membrane protein implicated in regulation of membrane protease activity